MQRFYEKSPLLFSLCFVGIYVVGMSAADGLSESVGIPNCISLPFAAALAVFLLLFVVRGRARDFGLCASELSLKQCLFYLPLVLMCGVNFLFGATLQMSLTAAVLYACTMLFVGLLEELIFRGLLFGAMAKESLLWAVLVSGITFGIGHIVNLIGGKGELLPTLLQVVYAAAAGILFAVLFVRTKSLVACIVTHCVINISSVFEPNEFCGTWGEVLPAFFLTVVSLLYAAYLWWCVPERKA